MQNLHSGADSRPPTSATADLPPWCPPDVWPFPLHQLEVGGRQVVYTDHGPTNSGGHNPTADPVLVMVHNGMWSFIFREVIARLGQRFRCITLDFPGHGFSSDPEGPEATLDDHSHLLGRFLDEIGLDNIVLVLHDLGGPVGIGAVAGRAERVRGLVLANTFLWEPDSRGLRAMLRVVSSGPMTGLDRLTGFIPRMTTTDGQGLGRNLDRIDKQVFLAGMRQPRRTARFHHLMGDAVQADALFRRVEKATAGELADHPVLTIFGEKNDQFGFQARHHQTFANHRGHVVEGGHHFPMMDEPDLFTRWVTDWIEALD